MIQEFLGTWGVRHRISSAHFLVPNGRAEFADKAAKRLLMSNTGPTGSLNQDRFLRAMLQLMDTPNPDCHMVLCLTTSHQTQRLRPTRARRLLPYLLTGEALEHKHPSHVARCLSGEGGRPGSTDVSHSRNYGREISRPSPAASWCPCTHPAPYGYGYRTICRTALCRMPIRRMLICRMHFADVSFCRRVKKAKC